MTTNETAASVLFTRDARGYDDLRRRLIPSFDEFYGTAVKLIQEWQSGANLEVLDVGAGTGLFSAMVLEACPVERLCLLDGSSAMSEQACARVGPKVEVELHHADMAVADLGGPWDLIVSALAIHHLSDEGKRVLYGRIRHALKPGGLFVNAEQVAGPGAAADQRYQKIWLEGIRRLGVSDHEIDKAAERMLHDKCAAVEDQLCWLRDVGFSDVDCSFKAWRFAVISGRA